MDLQFNQSVLKCLQCTVREYQTQEQTQDIRIPEGMPDIGIVLGCWGQVVIRGKEWRSDQVSVSGGVIANVLYMPEESGAPQVMDAWLPFSMKWSIPNARQDGTMQVLPNLRGADARVLTSRKLMIRANVGILMEAMMPAEFSVCQPESLPEDVQLLTNRYILNVPKETGEKAFGLDEMLELSASEPKIEQVVRLELSPQVLEQKVLADKLIFRGLCIAHLLYRSADGQLHSRDFDLPFSQYADLSGEFAPEATMQVIPVVTNLEYDHTPEGGLHLKAGFSGQYMIFDKMNLDLVQDAYSPVRTVEPTMSRLTIPAVLESNTQTLSAQVDPMVDVMRPIDICFWQDQPYVGRDGEAVEADLSGTFQMLYYDPEGQLQIAQTRWEDTIAIPADESCSVAVSVHPGGKCQYSAGALRSDLLADYAVMSGQGLDMVCALDAGEMTDADPQRPSMIITKAGNETLWQIAKANGSTVDLIRQANALTAEPAADSILLIPVK